MYEIKFSLDNWYYFGIICRRGIRMTAPATEQQHPGARGLHALPADAVLARLLAAQAVAADGVAAALPALAEAAALGAAALEGTGRLIYAGAGSSGLMALADCLELSGTYGIAPARTPMLFAGGAAALLHMEGAVEDRTELAGADLARLRPGPADVVICVSASGATPYTVAVARGAKAAGAAVVGIANVAASPLAALADVAVALETGAEMVAGSTRMAAGTAQKIALNLLSTLIGVTLGHVHDGYMVNLVADNAKLRRRAAAIVARIAGCGEGAAVAALAAAGGAVKPAVLIAAGATPAGARALLGDAGGHLGPALARISNANQRAGEA